MIYLRCAACGRYLGRVKDGFEAKEVTDTHTIECDEEW